MDENTRFRACEGGFRWAGVDLHAYKNEGSAPFKDISRQTLFKADDLAGELRYFEIAPGGYSTLERHEHVHAVMILRGEGRCLVGGEVRSVAPFDLVSVPAMTLAPVPRRRHRAAWLPLHCRPGARPSAAPHRR